MIKKLFKKWAFSPVAKKKTVLVIDDSDVDRRLAVSMIGKAFLPLAAASGLEGIALARERLPDVIVLDFMMPGMQGHEVCRVLKEDERTRHIPVIFLTGMDTPDTVVDSFKEGAETYLTKPIRPAELIRQIELALETACSVKE